ncbi:MAG TPA: flagellar motor protein MotB [Acetobacteraceae bacterium]|jgi:chemotaxis protein MotB|nr:flagellar motor protein MotB [Acetobacteraceae bacterium]
MARKRDKNAKGDIVIRREEVVEGEGHGGAWKVAYADFVTAMMAFFLLMWLLNATTEDQRKGLADYFSPSSVLSHNSSGTGQPFGGRTAFSDGAMVSDRGAVEANIGQRPVVDPVDPDQSDVVAQPLAHREDVPSKAPDQGGRMAAQPQPAPLREIAVARPTKPGEAAAGDVSGKKQTEAELRAELERREKQAFEQAAQQIREAVTADPQLAELARQLQIDITPDGLRIQILDAEREAMFPLGSAVPNDHARMLLQKIAPVLAKMPQDVSISGHTDAAPFAGPGRSNWELSADRANATRRLLVDAGLVGSRIRSVTGNAERDLLVPADPLAPANRRISIQVLRSVPLSAKAPP